MSASMKRVVLAAVAASVAAVAACAGDHPVVLPSAPVAPAAAAAPRTSYLVASDSMIAAGGDLFVSANVDTAIGPERIASYVAHVRFDSRQLAYVSDEAISGVMRAVNATDSAVVTIAGATATGVPDSRLFILHFRARTALRNPALELVIDELNTVGYANRTLSIQPVHGVRLNLRLR
ncbi:MAG: hypothetical protein ACREN6_06855 [Gemmatimonadaceae bacterium]